MLNACPEPATMPCVLLATTKLALASSVTVKLVLLILTALLRTVCKALAPPVTTTAMASTALVRVALQTLSALQRPASKESAYLVIMLLLLLFVMAKPAVQTRPVPP